MNSYPNLHNFEKKQNEKDNIKKILNLPELEKEKNRSSSIEESILDKIRK